MIDEKRLAEFEKAAEGLRREMNPMLFLVGLYFEELAAEVRRLKKVEDAAKKLDAFLPHGYGEKCVAHYDPEVEGLHDALKGAGT